MNNFWDYHISNHENYIRSYGEGEGSPNRKRLFKYIKGGETVLDVGCGPGCNYGHDVQNEKKIKRYRGVDISQKFIEACRRRFPEAEWEIQDADKLKEEYKSWDVVILQDVLDHLPGYKKAIRQAVRIAKKRIIIVLWVPLHNGEDKIIDKGDGGYHSSYNRTNFMKFIKKFGEVTTDEEHRNRSHWYFIIDGIHS